MLPEPERRLPAAARTLWALQYAGTGVVAGVIALSALGGLGALVLVVAPLLGVAAAFVRFARWRYEVREDAIDLRHGVWSVRRTLVPIRRVQHVDTESGPLQGSFDLATVSFHTAAGSTEIPALTRGEAETVRRRVGELAQARDDV